MLHIITRFLAKKNTAADASARKGDAASNRNAPAAGEDRTRALPPSAAKLYSLAPKPDGTAGRAALQQGTKQEAAPTALPDLDDFRMPTKPRAPLRTASTRQAERTTAVHASHARTTPASTDDDVAHITAEELAQFEEALASVEESGAVITPTKDDGFPSSPLSRGFFHEFERALEKEALHDVADHVVKEDILNRMKQFHAFKEQGKTYHFTAPLLKKALKAKLSDLKKLEEEWYNHKKELKHLQGIINTKEKDIDKRVAELKELIAQFKHVSILEKEVPEEHAFLCSDGRKLRSLLQLKEALLHSTNEAWAHAFAGGENHVANWVATALGDATLASSLRPAKNREELLQALYRLTDPEQDSEQTSPPPATAQETRGRASLEGEDASGGGKGDHDEGPSTAHAAASS
ncbi:hypothetical protein D6783_01805 [Candidatus Woesearchaeota archaeon]|nr:MAG: hypothetical protein D6783_01805 [Candidatus Woesearchaeota archaeon]